LSYGPTNGFLKPVYRLKIKSLVVNVWIKHPRSSIFDDLWD
jgi:hypothetical protein